jgi:mannosyltransferase OCH1-like enzyme
MSEQRIPKVIYKCCKNKSDIDHRIAFDRLMMKINNPDYTFVLYDDDECVDVLRDYNKDLLEIYLKINPNYGTARGDFFRYVCIYKNGGIYLDLKSSISETLDNVIKNDDRYLLSHWDNQRPDSTYYRWGLECPEINTILPHGEFMQWFLAAEPNHPFLEKVIEQVSDNINNYTVEKYGVGKPGVCNLTGPFPYTLTIAKLLEQKELYRLTNIMEVEGFKYTIFSAALMHESIFKDHYKRQTEPVVLFN